MKGLFQFLKLLPEFNRLRAMYGAKAWYKSKTVWFNTITFVSGVAVTLWGDRFGLSEAQIMGLATAISAGVNYALRLVTFNPVWHDNKGWLSSRTFWVNAVALFSSLLALVYGAQAQIPATELAAIGVGLHTLINLVLRATTRQPLGTNDASMPRMART